MAMKKWLLILGFVFAIIALGGCITTVQEPAATPDDTTKINSNESQPEQIALRIAWEAVKKTERYSYWKTQGAEYAAVPRPYNAQGSADYDPELWAVDFILPFATDQGIHVIVNTNTGTVLYIYEDQA